VQYWDLQYIGEDVAYIISTRDLFWTTFLLIASKAFP